jgi:uncharacterized membrane protein
MASPKTLKLIWLKKAKRHCDRNLPLKKLTALVTRVVVNASATVVLVRAEANYLASERGLSAIDTRQGDLQRPHAPFEHECPAWTTQRFHSMEIKVMGADADISSQRAGAPQLGLPVRRVPLDAPFEWLARGWRDLCTVPFVSLAYGALFTFMAWVLVIGLSLIEAQSAIPVLAAGFVLVGPLLAAGLYETSRRLEKGEKIAFRQVFDIGSAAYGRLAFFGVVLFFAYVVWILLAFMLLMLFLGGAAVPPPSELVHTLLFTNAGLGLLISGTLIGAALAAIVFSISTVAVPLLLVKDVDAVSAMVTSVRAVSINIGPMLLWAALIAGFMLQGTVTLFVGLVVAFPLLGHATWHAFRALVNVDIT